MTALVKSSLGGNGYDSSSSCIVPAVGEEDADAKRCFSCQSTSLFTDWKEGDTICTDCGVINEEHVLDPSGEWKAFNDAEDIIKGLPPSARCGLVPNDESRYIGGLQPTSLSKSPFGGSCQFNNGLSGSSFIEKRLMKTHSKIEKMLQVKHTQQLKDAEYARRVLIKRRKHKQKKTIGMKQLTNENEAILEEAAMAAPAAPSYIHQKWSIQRAILLFSSTPEDEHPNIHSNHAVNSSIEQERTAVLQTMDKSQRAAAKDVYRAYSVLKSALHRMSLQKLTNECAQILSKYADKKDGFHLRGIITRDRKKNTNCNVTDSNSSVNINDISSFTSKKKIKLQEDMLRDSHKHKQITTLCAAIIYIMAKKHGMGRSLNDTCMFFHDTPPTKKNTFDSTTVNSLAILASNFLRPKHISKAVTELKIELPMLFQSLSNPAMEASNMVQHLGANLNLPKATIGSIQTLALTCGKEQMSCGMGSGTKPSIVCASVTYMVCLAGGIMQRLAKQALLSADNDTDNYKKVEHKSTSVTITAAVGCKTRPRSEDNAPLNKRKRKTPCIHDDECCIIEVSNKAENPIPNETKSAISQDNVDDTLPPVREDFDALASLPLHNNDTTNADKDDEELEILQGWFSWSNQSDWARDLEQIQDAGGGSSSSPSKTSILEYYKRYLHPRRAALLHEVHIFLMSCKDADVCYLVNITSAAPLMILGQL